MKVIEKDSLEYTRKRKRLPALAPAPSKDAASAQAPSESTYNTSHALISLPTSTIESTLGFKSVKDYCSHIFSLSSRVEQYDALLNVAQIWIARQTTSDQVAEILDDLAAQLNLRDMMNDDQSGLWTQVTTQANSARDQRSDRDGVREKVCDKLGRVNVRRDFIDIWEDTRHTWKYFHSLTTEIIVRNISYNEMKRAILQVQLRRLSAPKRGTSPAVMIVAKDLIDARDLLRLERPKDETELRSDVTAAGYSVDANGFIRPLRRQIEPTLIDPQLTNFGNGPIPRITEIDSATMEKISNAILEEPIESMGLPTDMMFNPPMELMPAIPPTQLPITPPADFLTDSSIDLPINIPREFSTDSPLRLSSDINENADDNSLCEQDANEEHDSEFESSEDDISSDDDDEEYEDPWDEPTYKRRKTSHKCSCTDVPKSFTDQFKKKVRPDAITQSHIIRNWFKYQTAGVLCFDHTRSVMNALGMKTHSRRKNDLDKILIQYHAAVINNKLGDFKSDEATYHYFCADARPARMDDSLGVYKYAHNKVSLSFAETEQRTLQQELNIDVKTWDKIGSINMDGMSWWKSGEYIHEGMTIFNIAELEFDMYDYHLRAVNNRPNFGWLRCMYHGLVQQVMRQDPWYWMMYVALRGDFKHDLVSYPYYTKYQHEGDSTFFRHIDINLPQLIQNGQGLYQIQGTLSLDDERDDDCTQLLPGMHKNVKEWTRDLLKRPDLGLGAAIHNVGSKEYTEEDEMKYGISWTSVPCKALQVRITDPRIPHGAMGPAKGIRRTMLPWYVSLQTGLHHLEIGEAGTFDDLADAHRNLTPGPRSPSGLPNRYGKVPYSFPAAIPITGLGVLSDALVCRCRHDSSPVMALKKQLLLGGTEARHAYLHQWRKKAVVAVVEGWKEVEKLERECFGEKSWFKRQELIAKGENVDEIVADIDEKGLDLGTGCHGHEDEL